MLSEPKLKSVIVLSSVFKRPKKIILILLQLGRCPPNGLISMLLCPLRELREGSLWLGMAPSSKAMSFSSKTAITVQFSSIHNGDSWKLTTVYGPCQGQDRQMFIDWLNDIQIDDYEN
jgi:hypothetical protein